MAILEEDQIDLKQVEDQEIFEWSLQKKKNETKDLVNSLAASDFIGNNTNMDSEDISDKNESEMESQQTPVLLSDSPATSHVILFIFILQSANSNI